MNDIEKELKELQLQYNELSCETYDIRNALEILKDYLKITKFKNTYKLIFIGSNGRFISDISEEEYKQLKEVLEDV